MAKIIFPRIAGERIEKPFSATTLNNRPVIGFFEFEPDERGAFLCEQVIQVEEDDCSICSEKDNCLAYSAFRKESLG